MADPKDDPNRKDAPIENPKVDVKVEPAKSPKPEQQERNRRVSKGIEEKVKENVEKALEDNKSGGSQRQLDAAKKVVEDAAKQVPRQNVEEIKVKVDGRKDGKHFSETLPPSTPSEGTDSVEPKK